MLAINNYGDAVWRTASIFLRQKEDIQDVFQDVFLRYSTYDGSFNDENHKKAWLIQVAKNRCLDIIKAPASSVVPLEKAEDAMALRSKDTLAEPGNFHSEVIEALKSLGEPTASVLYMALVEEIPATEISSAMEVPVNTVYSWISRGKAALREALS